MNFLTSIVPSEFKHHIVARLKEIASRYPGTRLAIAIQQLSDFVDNYASKTPAKLALIYAFGSIEKEAVNLLTNVYLAILEMRGFNTRNISAANLEYLNALILKILHKAPAASADYKAYCKKNGHLYTEQTTQLRLNNKLMDAYFDDLAKNIVNYKDPLIHEVLKVLEVHRLIIKTEKGFDFDSMRYLMLFMVLKLHFKVNVTAFLNSLTQGNIELGQFEEALTILVTETWPKALDDIFKAEDPIKQMAQEWQARGDAFIVADVNATFPVKAESILLFTAKEEVLPKKVNSRELLRAAFL